MSVIRASEMRLLAHPQSDINPRERQPEHDHDDEQCWNDPTYSLPDRVRLLPRHGSTRGCLS